MRVLVLNRLVECTGCRLLVDINNLLVLTGDIHTSWANEIYKNPATLLGDVLSPTPLAAEFVCPSVTSPGFPAGAAELAAILLRTLNPHIRYAELKTPGFMCLNNVRKVRPVTYI